MPNTDTLENMKRFLEWIRVKERLDRQQHEPPLVSEGDLWWISIGMNVGSEIYGKDSLFSRPAIIYKKFSHGFYFVIPTTTTPRKGSWYVPFNHQERYEVACLHQARAIDHRRLSTKLGTIDEADFARIKEGFRALYDI